MHFIKYEFDAGPSDVIQVTIDNRANVRLLDPLNFEKYEKGKQHDYYGGYSKFSPIEFRPPTQGHWYVVIDLGGYPGRVRASAQKLDPPDRQIA